MEYRVGFFLLPHAMNAQGYIDLMQLCRKRVEGIARGRTRPFLYSIQKAGKVERRDTEEWLQHWRDARADRGLPPLLR